MKRKRLALDTRIAEILDAAIKLSHIHGYTNIRRAALADAAGCSDGLITARFGTITALQRAVMGEALRRKDLVIIAQGLAARDSRAMGADESLRRAAAATLA